jgi:hypothetical protein
LLDNIKQGKEWVRSKWWGKDELSRQDCCAEAWGNAVFPLDDVQGDVNRSERKGRRKEGKIGQRSYSLFSLFVIRGGRRNEEIRIVVHCDTPGFLVSGSCAIGE